MKPLTTLAVVMALLGVGATPAAGAFGLRDLDVTFTPEEGTPPMQAGSHPDEMTTVFGSNTEQREVGGEVGEFVEAALRNLDVEQAAGFVGNPTAVPPCETVDFLVTTTDGAPLCPNSAAVGFISGTLGSYGRTADFIPLPVYLLKPPPGVAAKLGFYIEKVPITIDIGLSESPPYKIVAKLRNVPQVLEVFASEFTLWGNPADPAHNAERGSCRITAVADTCPADIPVRPFLTLPRNCGGSLTTIFRATPWLPSTDAPFEGSTEARDSSGSPTPSGVTGCSRLNFSPQASVQPSTEYAESPTGLEFNLEVDDEGLTSRAGIAHADIRKVVVRLPQGITANPSAAEGLAVCSPADLARETVRSEPGEGCPQASKLGSLEVETPILEGKTLHGQVFIAQQDDPTTATPGAENPFDSLLALYLVIRDRELGIIVKQAGKVEPLSGGQLVTSFDDIPQFPLSDVRFRFREGGRSPLISPGQCGTHSTVTEFTPWTTPAKALSVSSSFQITRGVGGGPCPPAGRLPFSPGFSAGTINNSAGTFSPFYLRLTRRDGDQDLTRFSAELPPGLVAKLAGTTRCSDAAIAAAKGRTGRAERAAPSCPASSEIGRVEGGAGVGSQLTYVPGKLYLAGPVGGAPLSVVAIVPAVAGPFDVGTVVVRQALQIDRRTAEVRVDSSLSDPIPHFLAGIPLKVRDIRVHVDRPEFTLNPTSCDPLESGAEIWGGGNLIDDVGDDAPVSLAERFQAANCSRLGFKPHLSFRLEGGTERGDHPALRGVYRPRRADANLSGAVIRFPRSAFLDQAHIRTICTRVQFAAERCPKGAIYGHAVAYTPLLDEPLKGPVYLRSSNHDLPDFVADLHGLVDVEAVARIDSKAGGIRATFSRVPDAPITKVVVSLPGGERGLIVNSRDLCAHRSRADVKLTAHNGKRRSLGPTVRPQCGNDAKRGR